MKRQSMLVTRTKVKENLEKVAFKGWIQLFSGIYIYLIIFQMNTITDSLEVSINIRRDNLENNKGN